MPGKPQRLIAFTFLGLGALIWFFFATSNTAHAVCVIGFSLAQGFNCVDDIREQAGVRDLPPRVWIRLIIQAVLTLAAVLALGAVIAGAVMYITSLGNEEQAKRAKMVILFAIIGLLLALLSVLIVNVVLNIFR